MGLAVIRPALCRGRDHQRSFARRDLQLAFVLRDRVVVGLEVRAFGVDDRVRLFTLGNRRYTSGRLDVAHFAIHEAVAAYRHVGLRQSCAVIRLLSALRRQRYFTRVDRQFAGNCRDRVVVGHVLFAVHDLIARLDRVVAFRRVGHVRHAARGFRYQLVAGQQLAARHRHCGVLMRAAVVGPLVACRRDRDRHRGVLHRQLAVLRGNGVVAGRTARELIALHHVVDRALARERDAAFNNCADLVIADQAVHVVLGPAVRRSVVCEGLILSRDRHSLRIDRQRAGFGRDHIARGHVLFAVHDLVARLDRVVAFRRVGHVRHAARGFRYQLVAGQQLAARHRHCGVLMRAAVVGPLVACRRDRDRHRGVLHRQLAVLRGNGVVAGRTARELIALHHVVDRALARERDAAFNNCADLVIADQAVHVVARVAVRGAVVRELFALRRDRHSLRIDRQRAGGICYNIIGRNVGDIRLIRRRQVLLGAFADVGDRRRGAERRIDSGRIAVKRARNGIFAVQLLTIIGLALSLSRDGQRQRVVDLDQVAGCCYRDRSNYRIILFDRQFI